MAVTCTRVCSDGRVELKYTQSPLLHPPPNLGARTAAKRAKPI